MNATKPPEGNQNKSSLNAWWKTSCEVCNRWRLIILWGIVMWFVYDYFWL